MKTKSSKHFMPDGTTVDYNLVSRIKNGDNTAKEELLNKYNNLIAVQFNKFITALKARNLGNYYPNDEYWQNAVIAFEKALNTTSFTNTTKSGQVKTVDPKKYFFYIRFSLYLTSMNRDLLLDLSKSKAQISYESMTSTEEEGTKVVESYIDGGKTESYSPETLLFRKSINDAVNEILTENKGTLIYSVLCSMQKNISPRNACRELSIRLPEYNKAKSEIQNLFTEKLKKVGSIPEIMGQLC